MLIKKTDFIILSVIILCFYSLVQAQSLSTKNKIINHQYQLTHNNPNWEINAEYPEIILTNKQVARDFNTLAKTLVMTNVETFKQTFANDNNTELTYDMSISYTVELLNDNLVSLFFQGREFTGGAHGNSWSFTLNYDLKNNKKLELRDLFKGNVNFLSFISKQSIHQIMTSQGESAVNEWITGGASENIENFKSWNMTSTGLKITFDPYQVASYAEGIFTTLIPYKSCTSILTGSFLTSISQ